MNEPESSLDPITQNTKTILELSQFEEKSITRHQRILEYVSGVIGRPFFLGLTLLFVSFWIAANLLAHRMGFNVFDPPPFPLLQGLVGVGALLTTIIVLIKQNRLSKMEDRRAHLELQVNLLTEQKATKLISLMEELRRDLPMIKDRYDAESIALQVPTNPNSVLAALDGRKEKGGKHVKPDSVD
ncbi:DUF1003 domain-containing protein [Solimicrobium silvestre]|uniref:Putative membrane protein n=1 Tax=Solimicrobium silvestre TaxID=2099400 RepID=A0A2S9GUR6_9BURK|nr:DUF1003 domain-containing protein [Solimicrobium silvestre]PRC91451.1 putative membrane protein [Solimicrobium silvestre]